MQTIDEKTKYLKFYERAFKILRAPYERKYLYEKVNSMLQIGRGRTAIMRWFLKEREPKAPEANAQIQEIKKYAMGQTLLYAVSNHTDSIKGYDKELKKIEQSMARLEKTQLRYAGLKHERMRRNENINELIKEYERLGKETGKPEGEKTQD